MDEVTGQVEICGYQLATGPLCHADTADPWCRHHSQEQYLSCCSCGEPAVRECPDFTPAQLRCGMALCIRCEHKTGEGHVRRRTPVEVARAEMSAALALGLKEASRRQLCEVTEANLVPLSDWLIDHLSTSVIVKMLSGLATPPDGKS